MLQELERNYLKIKESQPTFTAGPLHPIVTVPTDSSSVGNNTRFSISFSVSEGTGEVHGLVNGGRLSYKITKK